MRQSIYAVKDAFLPYCDQEKHENYPGRTLYVTTNHDEFRRYAAMSYAVPLMKYARTNPSRQINTFDNDVSMPINYCRPETPEFSFNATYNIANEHQALFGIMAYGLRASLTCLWLYDEDTGEIVKNVHPQMLSKEATYCLLDLDRVSSSSEVSCILDGSNPPFQISYDRMSQVEYKELRRAIAEAGGRNCPNFHTVRTFLTKKTPIIYLSRGKPRP